MYQFKEKHERIQRNFKKQECITGWTQIIRTRLIIQKHALFIQNCDFPTKIFPINTMLKRIANQSMAKSKKRLIEGI